MTNYTLKMTIKYKWKMTSTRLSKTNINKILVFKASGKNFKGW